MSVVAAVPTATFLRYWRDRALWTTIADVFAVLTALALPWSTSLVAIFVVCWLGAVAWVMDYRVYLQSLRQAICYLPLAIFGLAVIGTLWSDASWDARLFAVGPTVKLLVLPALFYHFQRSNRGMWVLVAFLASCTLLMAMSWIVAVDPGLTLKPEGEGSRGIFVKNYINQSQEFTLCAVALVYPIVVLIEERKFVQASLLAAVLVGFIANMVFVIVSRTALVTVPVMLAVLAMKYLKRRNAVIIACATVVLAAGAWTASPHLRQTIASFSLQYRLYKEQSIPTSVGERLEFWRKSLHFVAAAPLVGHGTGSARSLFEQTTTAPKESVIANPHNQSLNVAIQWGLVGVITLYALWLSHFRLFQGSGLVAAIGTLVVIQNVFTSLFNSHLFDFHEGWMYVLGVGVAGGLTLKGRQAVVAKEPVRP